MTAERAGPLIGGLVATLPISAGPVYIFLALDHDAHFIAQSALGSLVTNALNVVFAVTYALLAQKRPLPVSLGGAFAVWIALSFAVGVVPWTLPPAIAFNVVGHRPVVVARASAAPRTGARGRRRAGTTWCCAPAWSPCWSVWW